MFLLKFSLINQKNLLIPKIKFYAKRFFSSNKQKKNNTFFIYKGNYFWDK